jgi:hypothetical protein
VLFYPSRQIFLRWQEKFFRKKTGDHRHYVICPKAYNKLAETRLVSSFWLLDYYSHLWISLLWPSFVHIPLMVPLCSCSLPVTIWAPWWQSNPYLHNHIHRAVQIVWYIEYPQYMFLDEIPSLWITTVYIPIDVPKAYNDSDIDTAVTSLDCSKWYLRSGSQDSEHDSSGRRLTWYLWGPGFNLQYHKK